MKSNILINCFVLFYNVGIFPSDSLTFFILIDLHAYSEVFATEPEKALPLYQWALEILEKVLGPQHKDCNNTQQSRYTLYSDG